MIVTNLELYNFRNYDQVHLQFVKGLNVLVGTNGSGKTNIVEAIDMLSLGYSFRSRDFSILIKQNKEKAKIDATLALPQKCSEEILFSKKSKMISINGKNLNKVSQLAGIVDVSTFLPEDVFFFDKEPANRRRFLNERISKKDKSYLQDVIDFEKILKERNAMLKLNSDQAAFGVIDEQISTRAANIVEKRTKLVNRLQIVINDVLKKLTNDKISLNLVYDNTVGTNYDYKKVYLSKLKSLKEKELILQSTTIGPHRDDLKAYLKGKEVKTYASQGQKRLIAIALRLATYYSEEDYNKKPIIILDDVLSELDEMHQENLISLLNTMKQVFITTTQYENYANAIFMVNDGKVTRR